MSRWYSYNLVVDGEVIDTGTKFGTGVSSTPMTEIVDKLEYDEAFVYYVNDTSDTGELIHLPSREHYKFNIYNSKPYIKSVENFEENNSIFDKYEYDLSLCGNYS